MMDFIFILFLTLIGIFIGLITGLIPGFHINNVALMLFFALPIFGLNPLVYPLEFSIILISAMIIHQFIEFIPLMLMGAPQEENALSLLPAQKMIINGEAILAAKLTLFGCITGIFFAFILLIFAFLFIPSIYQSIRPFIAIILISVVFILILMERKISKIFIAIFVFLISGYFGFIILHLNFISASYVLFPAFAGLFGLSQLITNFTTKIGKIEQKNLKIKFKGNYYKAGFLGSFCGMLAGTLPGLGPSQLGILMALIFGADVHQFIISVAAINTSDSIFSLISIYTIGNARSGVAVMIDNIMNINFNEILLFLIIIAFVSLISVFIFLKISKVAVNFIGSVDFRKINIISFLLILLMIYFLIGIYGVIIAMIAMLIGLISIFSNISRTHCMGILLIPAIFFFLEI